jgi:hypothetical protein
MNDKELKECPLPACDGHACLTSDEEYVHCSECDLPLMMVKHWKGFVREGDSPREQLLCGGISAGNSLTNLCEELERSLAASKRELSEEKEGWRRTYDHDVGLLKEKLADEKKRAKCAESLLESAKMQAGNVAGDRDELQDKINDLDDFLVEKWPGITEGLDDPIESVIDILTRFLPRKVEKAAHLYEAVDIQPMPDPIGPIFFHPDALEKEKKHEWALGRLRHAREALTGQLHPHPGDEMRQIWGVIIDLVDYLETKEEIS